jgi:diguanylate cyclase
MEKVKALEQLAMRLSHISDGVDDDVDKVLLAIRRLLKEGGSADKIEKLSGQLARTLMASTGINPDKARKVEGGYDLSGLRKLVKSMPVSGADQTRMGELVEQVASGTTAIARQKALVDLLGVAAEALRGVAARDKSDAGVLGWLNKKSASENGEDRYVGLFVQLLQRLVEHIDVLNGNALRSQEVKDTLEHLARPEQAQSLLHEVIEEIETIDARIRAERDQTSNFLGDLHDKLGDFEGVLSMLSEDGGRSVARSEMLQSKVDEDTRELGEATMAADVETIRGKVGEGLARITQRLAQHVVEEREQHEAAQQKVLELNERLAVLEDEAHVLRSEIRNKSDLALKDSLTGVYNRAGYEERVVELVARWERSAAPLSIVFVDCNKFKEINDTFGHAAGDLVLVKVAEVLSERSRASDIVCRYGGDEFVILLPDTRVAGAETFARSAFEEIRDAGFNDNGKPLDVTISCGVTELITGDTQETAIARADEAMYLAKKMSGVKVSVVV